MTILYTQEEFDKAKSTEYLKIACDYCHKEIFRYKKQLKHDMFRHNRYTHFCNNACRGFGSIKKINICCTNCNLELQILPCNKKKSKSGNFFCSQSCAAIYNNTHKKHGTRRSKLEVWLQDQLTILYPKLDILYSDKETINSELDIYIPSLNLAFELNGIFHYEPIFGPEKLSQIQNNDGRKFQACLERGIELVIIDTSFIKYSIPKNFQKIFDIIKSILNIKLSGPGGV